MMVLLVVISLSFLILMHEFGHFLVAKAYGMRVDEFGFGFPPRLFGKKMGGTVYSINLLPFGGFVKIYGEDGEIGGKTDEGNFSGKSFGARIMVTLAGVLMNIVCGWFLFSGIFMTGSPKHLIVSEVADASPAASVLERGDLVLSVRVGEVTINDPVKSSAFVELARRSAGEAMELTIEREGVLFPVTLTGRTHPPEGQGPLGISVADVGFEKMPFFSAVGRGFLVTLQTLHLIAAGFVEFFSKIFVTPRIVESIAGPVGIVALASKAGTLGVAYLFQFIAVISLNLAVLNMLPLPALDGGRCLLFLIERFKGSPISLKVQRALNAGGFIFLLFLMIFITVQDIIKMVR